MDLLDKLDTLLSVEINEAKGWLSSKTKKSLEIIEGMQKGSSGVVFEREFIDFLDLLFAKKFGKIKTFANGRAIDCIIGPDNRNGIRISLKNNKTSKSLQLYFADLTNFIQYNNKHYIIHSVGDIKNGLTNLKYYMFEVVSPQKLFEKIFRTNQNGINKYLGYAADYKNKYDSVVKKILSKRPRTEINLPLNPTEIVEIKKQLDLFRIELITKEKNEIRKSIINKFSKEIRDDIVVNLEKGGVDATEQNIRKEIDKVARVELKFPTRRFSINSTTGKPQYRYQVYIPLTVVKKAKNAKYIKILLEDGSLEQLHTILENTVNSKKSLKFPKKSQDYYDFGSGAKIVTNK